MVSEIAKKEKAHLGSKMIFLGLIFLFMGNGTNIQIANNAPFFILATIYNAFILIWFNKGINKNYVTFCLLTLFIFNVCYLCIGKYDFGITMSLSLNLLLIITAMNTDYNNNDIKIIVNGIIYSSIIFSMLLLVFGKGYSGAIYDKTTYTQAFGNHIEFEPNFLALLIITGFEFCVWAVIKNMECNNKKNIFIYVVFAAITLLSGLITGSRSVLVAACIYGVLLILFMKNHQIRNRLLIIIILLIIVLIISIEYGIISEDIYMRLFENSYNDGSNEKRLINWQYGMMAMQDNLFGSGPFEAAQILFRLYGYPNAAHNTFIAFGVYFGIIGFVAFACLTIGLAISAWKLKQRELFAMIVSMIVEWNILECQHTLSMWIFLLICILIINKVKQGEELNIF